MITKGGKFLLKCRWKCPDRVFGGHEFNPRLVSSIRANVVPRKSGRTLRGSDKEAPMNRRNGVFLACVVVVAGALGSLGWAQSAPKEKGKVLEVAKVHATAPAATDIDKTVTLDGLLVKKGPQDWSAEKGATIEGFVMQVETDRDGDIVVFLAPAADQTDSKQWVLAEVPPDWQKAAPELSKVSLHKLYGKQVSVTGWLYYDNKGDQDPRGTLWEIHPATSITAIAH
jgi:hypothetical protein